MEAIERVLTKARLWSIIKLKNSNKLVLEIKMRGFLKIVTKDPYLGQKLRWELSEYFDRIDISDTAGGKSDAMIFDCRLGAPIPKGETVFYLTEDGIVFYISPGIIAPEETGAVSFEITYEF